MRYRFKGQRSPNSNQSDQRLKAGLVGHWIGGGSGNTWVDRSGYGNHGALTNGPLWTLGEGGKRNALQFDGVNDYVAVPSSPNTESVTISAWVKTPSLAGRRTLVSLSDSGISLIPTLEIGTGNGGTNVVAVVSQGLFQAQTKNNAITTGIWLHLTYVKRGNGATHEIYVNGIEQELNSNTSSTYVTTADTRAIGRRNGANGQYSLGILDDVRIYNRALSAAEVALLASPSFSPVTRRRTFLGKRSGAAPPPTTSGNFFLMFQ